MAALYNLRQQAHVYFLRTTRWFRQIGAKLVQPESVSAAYVWLAMAGATLTLAHGIRSLGFLHPALLAIYAAAFITTGLLEARFPQLQGLGFTFMLVAATQLTLAESLILALVWYGGQWFRQKRQDMLSLVVQAAFLIVAVGMVSVLVHSPLLVKVLAIKVTCASLIYFAMNYLSALVVQSFEQSNWTGWRHDVAFGSWFLQAAFFGLLSEVLAETSVWTPLLAIPGAFLLHRWFQSDNLKTINYAEEMAALHFRTIEALALAIEAKDHTTHDHLQRVQVYATELGKDLKLTEKELKALRAAALLHDIGKLAVPEHIISKPGKLTREEFEKMKIHPTVGAEILERVEFPYPVAPIVAAHHEQWDGSGYPHGLVGEQIPIGARILSAVDCLDALATDRQYRRALPLDDAMKVLVKESGKSFDPQVVALLQRRYVELEEMAKIELKPAPPSELVIERGAAPAAGFEVGSGPEAGKSVSRDIGAAMAAAYQESQRLFESARDLNRLSMPEIFSILSVRIKSIIPYDGMAVYVRKGGALHPEFVTGDDCRLFSSLLIPMGEGLSGWVAENKKPIMNGNPSVEPGYLNNPTIVSMLQAALAVPLEGSDSVVGVLTLYRRNKDVFTADELRLLEAIGANLSVFVDNRSKAKVPNPPRPALDMLTGLPTAHSLVLHLADELARSRANQTSLRLLVCDVDDFAVVNDRFGRETGDRILTLLSDAFRKACRGDTYVARIGANKFAVVMPVATEPAMDLIIGQLCAAAVEIGWSMCREDLLRLSIGVVSPSPESTVYSLLRDAENRMYRLKRHRKGTSALSGSSPSFGDDAFTLESRPSISLQRGYVASLNDKTA